MTLKQHPLSAAFPPMSAEDFQALTDSIDNIGVQNPITLFEGMVIDGWHRYSAALQLGMDCPTVELGDVDPREFVMAQNKARRHTTQAQLGMATTAVYQWRPAGNPSFVQSGTECPVAKTNAELAEIAGVSEKTIKQAKAVQTHAAPEVQDAVKRGDIGLPKAAAIARLPQAEQAAAISKPLPKPAKKPAPAPVVVEPEAEAPPEYTELEAAHDRCSELLANNDELRNELAARSMGSTEEEQQQAAERFASLQAELNTARETIRALTISRDTYMTENAEMKRQMKAQREAIARLSNKK